MSDGLTEHVNVRFPEQLATAASRLAQQDGMSTGAWVRGIVGRELARHAPDLLSLPWRAGRRKGRNIYAVAGGDPDDDPEVGKMDTPELAAEACAGHNAMLEARTA